MENVGLLGKILLVACGAGLVYGGLRLFAFATRLWRLSLSARAMLATLLGAIYTFSPVDGIPDVIFGIGWLDDLVVIAMVAMYVYRTLAQRRGPRGTVRMMPERLIPPPSR
jgi:hypothetical protein